MQTINLRYVKEKCGNNLKFDQEISKVWSRIILSRIKNSSSFEQFVIGESKTH